MGMPGETVMEEQA